MATDYRQLYWSTKLHQFKTRRLVQQAESQSQATPDIEPTGKSLRWNHLGEPWPAHTVELEKKVG
jgi:hypothetical protein